ncbi:hypothetical protein D0Z03_000173 [Geotrichum reessii]|nr:hypothetical protein D0Z03_000173 [Galactomyces reessii]
MADNKTTEPKTASNIFGSSTSESPSKKSAPTFSFDKGAAPTFGFGDKSTLTTSTSGGLFANKTSTPTGNLFSQNPSGSAASTTASPSGNIFGKPATSTNSLFGQKTTESTPALSFGKPAEATTTSTTASSTGGGLFGNKPATNTSSTGLFGKPAESTATSSGSLFGAAKKPEEKSSGALFGTATKKPEETAKPSFSFGGVTTTKPADVVAKPSFGGAKPADTAAKSTENKASATPLFGAKPAENKTSTATESTPLFGTKPATSGTTAAVATTEKKEEAKPAVVATPAKPLKSAEPTQEETAAYLKNRSIEDIISKWTSVLSKLTKEFQTQASDINDWDKVLMENGDRITQMYTEVVVAERKQTSIDQTLDYINRQQDDVEALLDNYEAQAAEFLADLAGPDGLQPVDQEREKSYRLAEDLNEKLEGMSSNLTNVIKEMNTVQSDLANANPDDALTQIVKVLNSHLSSLQWIDTHTTELQDKLDQIQQLENVAHDSVENANRVFGSRYRN